MSALFPRSLVSEDDEMRYVLILVCRVCFVSIGACLALRAELLPDRCVCVVLV